VFKQMTKRMCGLAVVGVLAAGSAALRADLEGPMSGIVQCSAKAHGMTLDACVTPPRVCPNGPFTRAETCRGSISHEGCDGVAQPRVGWSDEETGKYLATVPCGDIGYTYNTAKCQCFGDLFGYCTESCMPIGGIGGTGLPCGGAIRVLLRCEQEQ
jgi:hypothetical protein